MRELTIVMYHYVRDLKNSSYQEIKGLDTELFKEQFQYLSKYYNFISAYDLIEAVKSGDALPPQAVLMTFDDGYMDHFDVVFPVLAKAGVSGCFFPPAKCITQNEILDVNKIHFILAATEDKSKIVDFIRTALDEHRESYDLKPTQVYWNEVAKPGRFDPPEVVYIKRMLQRELPEDLRNILTNHLFENFVTSDKKEFSQSLYMDTAKIAYLQNSGQYVGSHGFDHYWLNSLSREKQAAELDASLDFLEEIGSSRDDWIMCYPYGGYNETTLELLRERNCLVGLTTQVGIADLDCKETLILPRLDTNDLPVDGLAEPNKWTRQIGNRVDREKAV